MVRVAIVCCLFLAVNSFGQALTFESLNKLPAYINTACDEILPVSSPDGKTLYFARVACAANEGGVNGGSDVWLSQYNFANKEWSKPKNAGEVFNDKGNNAIVGMSSDGSVIYQINTTPLKRIKGIYVARKEKGKWSAPELEPIEFLETQEYFGMYVSPDLQTVIVSMKRDDGAGEEDLYVSRKLNEVWTQPKNLGASINTTGFEISPFLSSNTKRLFFASNGHKGHGGSDIFYCDRLDDTWTRWSEPVNLGDVINTDGFDAYFTMNDSVAYFTSSNGKSTEIYRAKVRH